MSNLKTKFKKIKIKNIKKLNIRNSYDLIVEKNPNFLLSNGVITHNTKQAQDSLRNIMETYSSNCFFIFSCNDISKIIEPIRSRCVCNNFENPNKADIVNKISDVCIKEDISISQEELSKLVDDNYPDIRSMIIKLQLLKINNTPLTFEENNFKTFSTYIINKDTKKIYETVYSGTFDIMGFNKWFFHKVFEQNTKLGLEKASKITMLLADTEKSWSIGTNLEIIFISNILQICNIL